jgi:hypothetical protein
MQKPLPAAVTTYDLLKTAALLLMVVDHIGAFFYPEEIWLRVAGRLSAPIWLFLVGYARSRDLSAPLWAGMMLLVLSQWAIGHPILPLNILATILIIRMVIDPVMNGLNRTPSSTYPVMILAAGLTFATFPLFEYGTGALLPAMLGYWVRRWEEEGAVPLAAPLNVLAAIAGVLYYGLQSFIFFQFTPAQSFVAGTGLIALFVGLTGFRGRSLRETGLAPVAAAVKMMGRHTLFFYVAHLLVFKAVAYVLNPERFAPFTFHILF